MVYTKAFGRGLAERAIKTWLQTFVAALGVQIGAAVTPDGFVALPWATAVITASIAAVLSAATSVGNAQFTAGSDPAASE